MPQVDPAKIGLFGISYAAGLALIAASRDEIAQKLAFIVSLGGYYDLRNPIQYVLTGTYQLNGKVVRLEPHPWARMIFALNNVDVIASGDDLDKIRQALRCRLELDEACAKAWEEKLSPEGKAVIASILGPPNEKLERIMSKAVERVSEIADRFSPSVALTESALRRMMARIYLVHGSMDTVIPCSETLLLEQMLKDRGHPAYRVLVSKAITHVDPNGKRLRLREKFLEGSRLIWFIMQLLKER